ncbi:MAG: hypothetical protein ABSF12_03375 [Bryobacteraceae bacterium]|jgi:hypothetical protein
MLLTALTVFHVILSLVGISSGLLVLTYKRSESLTALFLWTTVATSVTGFFFPIHKLTPGHIIGILSLIVLTIAFRARGRWRKTYAIAAVIALYLNVFVLVVQLFEKVPGLTPSGPPFQITQGIVLLLFVILGITATRKPHP